MKPYTCKGFRSPPVDNRSDEQKQTWIEVVACNREIESLELLLKSAKDQQQKAIEKSNKSCKTLIVRLQYITKDGFPMDGFIESLSEAKAYAQDNLDNCSSCAIEIRTAELPIKSFKDFFNFDLNTRIEMFEKAYADKLAKERKCK